jgi:hypothetical protein
MIALAILFAMQPVDRPAAQPQLETTPAPWPDDEREFGMVDSFSTQSDAEARSTMTRFANCVLDSSAEKAAELLQRDFRTASYRSGLQNLSRNNEGCARKAGLSGRMRMSNLAFAGALAEGLIGRREIPTNALLARAAALPAAPTYSFTDGVAMCVVRSVPDEVAALFASDVGASGESKAIDGLQTPAALCARAADARQPLSISPAGLRAMLATAAYRSSVSVKDI